MSSWKCLPRESFKVVAYILSWSSVRGIKKSLTGALRGDTKQAAPSLGELFQSP